MKVKNVEFVEFDSSNISHAAGYFKVTLKGTKEELQKVVGDDYKLFEEKADSRIPDFSSSGKNFYNDDRSISYFLNKHFGSRSKSWLDKNTDSVIDKIEKESTLNRDEIKEIVNDWIGDKPN